MTEMKAPAPRSIKAEIKAVDKKIKALTGRRAELVAEGKRTNVL